MDASKVGLGTLLLAVSGLTMTATDLSDAGVPLGLAGLAAVGLTAYALVCDARGRRLRG